MANTELEPFKWRWWHKRLTSRIDQNGWHIITVDYEGNNTAIVEVNQTSGPDFDLVLQNGPNFFYAADGNCIITDKTTGQNIHIRASINETWGGIT